MKVKDLGIFEGKSLTKKQNGDDMMRSRLCTITVSKSYFKNFHYFFYFIFIISIEGWTLK